MNKIVIIVLFVLVLSGCTENETKKIAKKNQEIENIELNKCIDGDTALFSFPNGEIQKVRFLFIDTPEYTTKKEKLGKEASEYTCSELKKASNIKIEYDGDRTDKYDRVLGWIFVDNKLIQEELAKKGFVKQYYDYGNYKYEKKIRENTNDIYKIFI